MITCAAKELSEVFEADDLYARLHPFRIFRISNYQTEPRPVYDSPEWNMSTRIFPARFAKVKTIYDSDFVKVKLFQDTGNNETVAIKFLKKFNVVGSNNNKLRLRHVRQDRELLLMKSLKHPYIVQVKEVLSMVDCHAIVMEYALGGELFDHVQANQRLSEPEAKRLMFQIFLAVDYLHSKGIVHRDLKLENILLDDKCNIKIADFGFAQILDGPEQILKTSCGSPCYAAPEIVLQTEGYKGPAVDIWSCGVIMFAMLFGHLPFEEQLYKFIATNNSLTIPTHTKISPEAVDLLKGILRFDPNKRLNLTQIFRHLWFANASFSQ